MVLFQVNLLTQEKARKKCLDTAKNVGQKLNVNVASSYKQFNVIDAITALKRRKLEHQVEWLEKQNYKEIPKILQIENKLLLEYSLLH